MKNILLLCLTIILISACDIIIPTPIPIPGPSPSPVASAQPSPTIQPTATPMPSPSPSPSPTPWVCPLADQPECGANENPIGSNIYGCCNCNEISHEFDNAVEDAIKLTKKTNPQLFNGEKVLYPDAYMQGVVNALQGFGFCSARGPVEDELAIKTTNSYNRQYDILTGDNYIRHRAPVCTCRPSRF